MPQKFVNLENLTSFWGNAKEYIGNERQEIEDQLYNWQKTEKAPIVQCEPVPSSELHPVVEFKFKETLPEGEKNPSNPSTISGVNSITAYRCSKNLYNVRGNLLPGGSGFTITNDDFLELTATNTSSTNVQHVGHFVVATPAIESNKTYTLILEIVNISNCLIQFNMNPAYAQRGQLNTGKYISYNTIGTFFKVCTNNNLNNANTILRFLATGNANSTFSLKVRISIIEGIVDSSNFKYEPYSGNEYVFSLNDTYYGGSIDLSTGLMTVTHIGIVFTGEENITEETSLGDGTHQYNLPVSEYNDETLNITCSHFKAGYQSNNCYVRGRNGKGCRVFPADYTTLQSFIEFIANQYANGTPLTLVYKLASSYTVQLTSQQIKSLPSLEGTSKRINTIYTDVDSIQVEYQKYVGIDSTLDNNSVNAIQNKVVNSALNTKVSLSGDETIGGTKTFSNTINGNITGDAGTVAGHIVSKDVPVNAAFTDTTYDPATQSTAGLMSAEDKAKLDAVGSVFTFKGSVIDDTYLPASDNANGDAYLAEDTGHIHVYDGSSFVDIGVWAGIPSATDAQIDALFED